MVSQSQPTTSPTPFYASIPQEKLDRLQKLLRLSPVPPATHDGMVSGFGVSSEWMTMAKNYWENKFSWRKSENLINRYPQFKVSLAGRDGRLYTIHYVGIFSKRKDAVPLLLLHGWPGSFADFYPLIPGLTDPAAVPAFHVIIPSLPGFAFSSKPASTGPGGSSSFNADDCAHLLHALMHGTLGFPRYLAQGSLLSQLLEAQYGGMCTASLGLARGDGFAAAATRGGGSGDGGGGGGAVMLPSPALVHMVTSSPLALLAWLGEMLLAGAGSEATLPPQPPAGIDAVLEMATLWWVTDTFPSSVLAFRGLGLL